MEAAFSADLFDSESALPTALTYGVGPFVIDNDVVQAYALRFHMVDQFDNPIDWATAGTPEYLKLRVTSNVPANNLLQPLGPGFWMTGAPAYPAGFGEFTDGWAYLYDNLGDAYLSSVEFSDAAATLAVRSGSTRTTATSLTQTKWQATSSTWRLLSK